MLHKGRKDSMLVWRHEVHHAVTRQAREGQESTALHCRKGTALLSNILSSSWKQDSEGKPLGGEVKDYFVHGINASRHVGVTEECA